MMIRTLAGLMVLAALAGCGTPSDTDQPTVLPSTEPVTVPSATSDVSAPATFTDPVAFAAYVQTAAIPQVVKSDAGVQYDIPADWQVSEGPQQSNFATPLLTDNSFAVIDYSVRGFVARTSIEKIYGQTGISEADAIPRLFESEGAPDYNLQQPTEITLPDGRKAQFAAYDNDDDLVAVYFITIGADDYLQVRITVRDVNNLVDDKLEDYRDLFDRIAASAQPAS